MSDDDILEEERQRLFAMVWERPATEVAKKLGISDVALSKKVSSLAGPQAATRLLGADCSRPDAKASAVTGIPRRSC